MNYASLKDLQSSINMRQESDTQVSVAWILLPVANLVLGIVAVALALVALFAAFSEFLPLTPGQFPRFQPLRLLSYATPFLIVIGLQLAIGAAFSYLMYLLVRRRNRHFARVHRFMKDLLATLRDAQAKRDAAEAASMNSADRTMREMEFDEPERNAALWAIFIFFIAVPLVNVAAVIALLYTLYFLGRDWRRHEQHENLFFQDIERACAQLSIPFSLRRLEQIPNRGFALYILVTIITLGVFGIYWLYTLIVDPNNHLRTHYIFEDELFKELSKVLSTST